jgi:hypothetical protein
MPAYRVFGVGNWLLNGGLPFEYRQVRNEFVRGSWEAKHSRRLCGTVCGSINALSLSTSVSQYRPDAKVTRLQHPSFAGRLKHRNSRRRGRWPTSTRVGSQALRYRPEPSSHCVLLFLPARIRSQTPHAADGNPNSVKNGARFDPTKKEVRIARVPATNRPTPILARCFGTLGIPRGKGCADASLEVAPARAVPE